MSICLRYHRNQEDARHVLNKAFFQILKNIGSYNLENSFEGWIKRIMVNTIINEYRSTKSYKSLLKPIDFQEEHVYLNEWEYDHLNDQIAVDALLELINQLPENEKQVLNLYAIDGYTHKEIGQLLSIPEGTSKWLLSNARKRLKKQLEKSVDMRKTMWS